MAKSTLNADGFDTGSNYHFGDKMLAPNFPRSLFDLSHLCSMTIKNAGYVFPITKWRTVPSDEFTISVRSLIRVMPQVVPLYSRQRLYIYAFYSRNGDLWENWNTFARKGLAGTTVKTIPTLNNNNTALSAPVAPDTLADYLDLPIGAPAAAVTSGKLSALPYMMYTRIWRDYFFNHNFAVKSESGSLVNSMQYLLPDNDDHFRLNDDGEIISFKENSVSPYRQLEAHILFAQQKYDQAFDIYNELTTSDLRSAEVFYSAARCKELLKDTTTMLALMDKFDIDLPNRQKEVEKAQACSMKNNGFAFTSRQLKRFVILNMLADSFASNAIEKYK